MTGALDTATVRFSRHAIERYQERVRPALVAKEHLKQELSRASEHGRLQQSQPDWLAGRTKADAPSYLLLGDDVVFPLAEAGPEHFVALTCLARGSISSGTRERRNRRRRAQRGS